MRLPLTANISTKDGVLAKNARMTNVLEQKNKSGKTIAEIRPGTEVVGEFGASSGNGIVDFNGTLLSVFDSQLSIVDITPPPVVSFQAPEQLNTVYFTVSDVCTAASVEGYSNIMVSGWGTPDLAGTAYPYVWTESGGFELISDSSTGEDTGQKFSDDGVLFGIREKVSTGIYYLYKRSTSGTITDLVVVASSTAYLTAVNSPGTAVTITAPRSSGVAKLWTESGGLVALTIPEGGTVSSAFDVSLSAAYVTGGYRTSGNLDKAYRWDSTNGMVDLGNLGGTTNGTGQSLTIAFGKYISEDGTVISGIVSNATQRRAFYWISNSGMVDLDGTASYTSIVLNGMSADGSIVVGQKTASGVTKAFSRNVSDGLITEITFPSQTSSSATGISEDGAIICGIVNYAAGVVKMFKTVDGVNTLFAIPSPFDDYFEQAYQQSISRDGDAVVQCFSDDFTVYAAFAYGGTDVLPKFRDLVAINNDKMDFVQSTL